METKPIELNVNLKREPFIKLYFDTSADYYDTFMWRKWSSTIIMAAIVIITTAVVMMTATLSKEKVIRFLAMVANSIPSMEKIQIIPVTIGTIMACFVAGIIFLKFCKYQWGMGLP